MLSQRTDRQWGLMGGGGGITIRDPRRKKLNTEDYEGVGKEKEVGKIV